MAGRDDEGESAKAEKGGYAVGYGRPPRHSQFQKGQSGNPKGRPAGTKNLRTVLREELEEPIRITANGKSRRVPAVRALLMALKARGLRGDNRATLAFLAMAERIIPSEEEGLLDAPALSPQEREVLLLLQQRLGLAARTEPSSASPAGGSAAGSDAAAETSAISGSDTEG